MVANYFFKCKVCGEITCIKYQMGFIENHPIRFKCQCGVTLNGCKDHSGIHFQNADMCGEDMNPIPSQVITCSPEFLTIPPKRVEKAEDIFLISPFIMATMDMEYEEFRAEFTRILSYKSNGLQDVKNCNDLFEVKNYEKLKQIIARDMKLTPEYFPMENDADILRAMNYVNQMQYMNEIGSKHLIQTQDLFAKALQDHKDQVIGMAMLLNRVGNLEKWRKDSVKLQIAVFEKIEYLLPVVGIEYYKSQVEAVLKNSNVITTASFDDIKTLYVDLYEHLCRTVGVVVGLDNIVTRGDFNKLRNNSNITGGSLEGFIGEHVHGKIVNYLSEQEPFEKLVGNHLNKEIRNAIGHFNYEAEVVGQVVPGSYGQIIRFIDAKDDSKSIEKTLKEICYYIWQMYKCLAEVCELIYRFQSVLLAQKGIKPSSLRIVGTNINLKDGTERKMKKIYPNDLCPCGSGKKYKRCCGKS